MTDPKFTILWRGKPYGQAHGRDAADAVRHWLAAYPEAERGKFRPEDLKARRVGR